MHFQLQEIPEDFFVDIVSRNNFLTTTLQVYDVDVVGVELTILLITNVCGK